MRDYARLDGFFDVVTEAVQPEPVAAMHADITRTALDWLAAADIIRPGMTVLDVGCGQGTGLEQFAERGLHAVGISLGEDARICIEKGLRVRGLDLHFMDFNQGEFDLIWARHVLEHSPIPLFALFEFKRILRVGGFAYVEVPAGNTECHHEINPQHFSILEPYAWHALFVKAGFEVLGGGVIDVPLGWCVDQYHWFLLRHPANDFHKIQDGVRRRNLPDAAAACINYFHLRDLKGVRLWRGEDLTGKRLYVYAHGGFGDAIQWSRFLPRFRSRHPARLALSTPLPLVRLLSETLPGIQVFNDDFKQLDEPDTWDFYVPMLAAVAGLGVDESNVSSAPYLRFPQGTTGPDLPEAMSGQSKPRVGIAWRSAYHDLVPRREIPLAALLPLCNRYRLVSLQKDGGGKDIATEEAEALVFDPMPGIGDLADTAALVAQLDLVISVDSVMVHLAGALGKPVILLGEGTPDGRWWDFANGTLLPWYGRSRIAWRGEGETWSDVIARLPIDAKI